MEGLVRAALRVHARRAVATHLEREDARDVSRERERLDVEHELDVLLERIRNARRSADELAGLAAAARVVARFNALNATLDFADVVEIAVDARAVGRAQVALERRHLGRDEV